MMREIMRSVKVSDINFRGFNLLTRNSPLLAKNFNQETRNLWGGISCRPAIEKPGIHSPLPGLQMLGTMADSDISRLSPGRLPLRAGLAYFQSGSV
jgi:hypothetical protein